MSPPQATREVRNLNTLLSPQERHEPDEMVVGARFSGKRNGQGSRDLTARSHNSRSHRSPRVRRADSAAKSQDTSSKDTSPVRRQAYAGPPSGIRSRKA